MFNMRAYLNALRQKKLEGLEEQPEASGSAPEVLDDPLMAMNDAPAELGQMDSEMQDLGPMMEEGQVISDDAAMDYVDRAQATPDIKDLTSEEVFGVSAPVGPAKTLREKAMQGLRRK